MNTPMLRIAAALLAAATLAGCALGGDKVAPTVFAPQPAYQADPAWPTVRWNNGPRRPSSLPCATAICTAAAQPT